MNESARQFTQSNHFHALPVHGLPRGALALVASDLHAAPGDPAVAVFTDLRAAPSVVVPADEPLDDARRLMKHAGVRMAFVLEGAGTVVGLVTAADLQGERVTLAAVHGAGSHRELNVSAVMTPAAQWLTLDMSRLANAQVGDIVATFRATGQRYLVVTENAGGQPVIRGLFSANRVERALGHPIEEELRTQSFAALAAALAHP